ncbi:MAG: type II toxin-antitoxin system VapC family toxin [Acidimicrobiales bacterium]
MTYYLDTSAFVKLFVAESESRAMRRWWNRHDGAMFSSDLLRTEALRTARRISPAAVAAARRFLDAVPLVRLDSTSYDRAGLVEPAVLRSLDALHLTAATLVGDELDGVVAYDDRLIDAAGLQGIPTVTPV